MKPAVTKKDFTLIDKMLKGWERAIQDLSHPYRTWFLLRFIGHPRYFDRETPKNYKRRYGFLQAGGGLSCPAELKSQAYILRGMYETFSVVNRAPENGTPLIWLDWPVPAIIVRAFGIECMIPYGMMTFSQAGGATLAMEYFNATAHEGVSTDVCGMNRLGLGAYLSGELKKPAAIISASHPCDSQISANQLFEYWTDVPAFYLDTVYDRSPQSVKYLAKNIFGMIAFLEKIIGRPMDWDRLKTLAEETNRCNQLLNELCQMHRAVPSPNLNFLMQYIWYTKTIDVGSPNMTMAAQILYDEAVKRLKRPGRRKRKEKIRVIIWDNPIIFTEITRWMQKQFGAVVVADFIGYSTFPPIDTGTRDSLIESIALDKLNMGMVRSTHGTDELTLCELENLIHEFSADCVIFNGNIGCKHNKAILRGFSEVCRRAGVPGLFMEMDTYDKRVVSEDRIKKDISYFFISNGLA